MGPLLVDLPFQVESALLVSDVTGGKEEGKTDSQQEHIPGEETAVVEESANPANQEGHDAQRGSDCGNNEFLRISNSDNISSIPHEEPREQVENERQGVDCQLHSGCSVAEQENG